MKHLRRLARRLHQSEIDLSLERRLAHLFSWHTDVCRGDLRCGPIPIPFTIEPWRARHLSRKLERQPNGHQVQYLFGERWHRWRR